MMSNIRNKGGHRPAILVLGATGAIGRGVVRAALDAGRPVIAVSPDADGLRDLQGLHAHADLLTLAAGLRADGDAAALAQTLRELDRPIHGAIVALCTERERGRLLDGTTTDLRDVLDNNVVAHLALAKHLLPLLAHAGRAGGYVLIDGPGANHPWAGYGHRSVGGAALQMLARVLHDEARAMAVRLQLVSLDWPVRTDANAKHACEQWPSAVGVGRRAIALLDRVEATPPQAVIHCTGPCPGDARQADAQHVSDGDVSLLSARCLQDARTLLDSLAPPLAHKEEPHGRPTRR
jgi:NAD(P)-dependent dehydrogenase (short-subunit alcohol dehydrogenase family)